MRKEADKREEDKQLENLRALTLDPEPTEPTELQQVDFMQILGLQQSTPSIRALVAIETPTARGPAENKTPRHTPCRPRLANTPPSL